MHPIKSGAYEKEIDWRPSVCDAEERTYEPILIKDKNKETDRRIVTLLFNTSRTCSSINAH
jgi:hypothetical protein